MAYTPSYVNTPVISKAQVEGTVRYLKDAEARSNLQGLINALGDAAYKGIIDAVANINGSDLPTGAVVKAYVDSAVAAIPDFDVVVVEELPTASADTFHKIYLLDATSPSTPNLYMEYITLRAGTGTELDPYTYSWEKIGDTSLDLSGYVPKTTTIAGVDLQDNITVSELQTALGLGNMAYANTASGQVPGETISGIVATGTPEGTVTVTLNQTSTAGDLTFTDYTPAGNITGTAISGGTVTVDLTDAASATTATITASDYTPAGNVSAPSITVTPTTDNIQPVTNVGAIASLDTGFYTAGTAATWTGQSYNAPTLGNASVSTFTTEGIVASIDTVDNEMLVLSNANTSNAVTAQGTFNAGDLSFGTFSGGTPTAIDVTKFNGGAVPTLGTAVAFLTAATAALDSDPVFTGTAENNLKVTKVEYYKQVVNNASLEGTNAVLGFSGTTVPNALVTGVNYDKASVNTATFNGNSASFNVGNITVAAQNVTVTPDAVTP